MLKILTAGGFFFCLVEYHRIIEPIIEWFGLEGTLKIIQFQPPCHGQGHLPLDQVAQSLSQPGPEHFQGGGICQVSVQPVPVPHNPQSKEYFP